MDRYLVKDDEIIDLKKFDPADTSGFDGEKEQGKVRLLQLNKELEELQELLYAEHKHKLLIVLQGMDTSGKDGVVRHVFEGVNPQGVKVASFKQPTFEELDHDYLWRVHKVVPAFGEMVIFNRSHYEDVLIARVHSLVQKSVWKKRYEHINMFEQMLADEGTTILKFFLFIDSATQKTRLQARLNDPKKHWKFNEADLQERKLWNDYIIAYEDVLNKTSTSAGRWYIVPSNRKWYRNLVIATIIVNTMKGLKMEYPNPKINPSEISIE